MSEFTEYECSCTKCVNMCKQRPCWGTPNEMKNIRDAGFGNRLMNDYWVEQPPTNDTDVYYDTLVESPAIVGYEGKEAPVRPVGRCTFLTEDNKCELHDLGLKPLEGRTAIHDGTNDARDHIVELWRAEGRKIERSPKDIVSAATEILLGILKGKL